MTLQNTKTRRLRLSLGLVLLIAGTAVVSEEKDPDPEKPSTREARRLYQEFFDRTMLRVSDGPVEAGPGGWKSRSLVTQFQPPVDADLVKGLLKHENQPGRKAEPQLFAYVSARQQLIAHYSDAKPRGIAEVMPDERVEVVFMVTEAVTNDYGRFHWCLVRKSTGEEGYIPDKLLLLPVKRERANWSMLSLPAKMQVRVDSSLSLRDSPSMEGSLLTSLYNGNKVTVTRWASDEENIEGTSGRWAFVKTEYALEGYVFAAYLVPEEDSPDEPPETFATGDVKFVRSPILRVREEPSQYGVALHALAQGSEVSILEVSPYKISVVGITAPWVKVRSGKAEGWTFGGFLSKRKGATISYDNIYRPFVHPGGDYRRVSSEYGPRIHPTLKKLLPHTGIDIAAPEGAPIKAPADGVVHSAQWSDAYGMLTILEHSGDLFTWFAHQRKLPTSTGFRVRTGQRVKAGEVIGEIGQTGRATGPHLHFEVRKGNATHMNPSVFIPR